MWDNNLYEELLQEGVMWSQKQLDKDHKIRICTRLVIQGCCVRQSRIANSDALFMLDDLLPDGHSVFKVLKGKYRKIKFFNKWRFSNCGWFRYFQWLYRKDVGPSGTNVDQWKNRPLRLGVQRARLRETVSWDG